MLIILYDYTGDYIGAQIQLNLKRRKTKLTMQHLKRCDYFHEFDAYVNDLKTQKILKSYQNLTDNENYIDDFLKQFYLFINDIGSHKPYYQYTITQDYYTQYDGNVAKQQIKSFSSNEKSELFVMYELLKDFCLALLKMDFQLG